MITLEELSKYAKRSEAFSIHLADGREIIVPHGEFLYVNLQTERFIVETQEVWEIFNVAMVTSIKRSKGPGIGREKDPPQESKKEITAPGLDMFRLTNSKETVDISNNTLREYHKQGLNFYWMGKAIFVSRAELKSFILTNASKTRPPKKSVEQASGQDG